jgi:predicted metal-binding protein
MPRAVREQLDAVETEFELFVCRVCHNDLSLRDILAGRVGQRLSKAKYNFYGHPVVNGATGTI